MRFNGRLKDWNDERGFGFIAPEQGGSPIFVHASAFPRDGRRPQIGEHLSFELEMAPPDKQPRNAEDAPRKRALHVQRIVPPSNRRSARQGPATRRRSGLSARLVGLAVLAGMGWLLHGEWQQRAAPAGTQPVVAEMPVADLAPALPAVPAVPAGKYSCNGRQHCAQMSSCEEAIWVLRNCPDTKMDGDNDGIPCEDQWCNGLRK